MKREISSEFTSFWKYLFPILWVPLTGFWAVAAARLARTELAWILFAVGWIIASGYLIWLARRLKFVSIDDEFVYVSQFRKQIQIPLAYIEGVKVNFGARPKLITLTLKQSSEFGENIVFVPTTLPEAAVRSHPLLEEIDRAVNRRRPFIPPSV